MRIKVTSVRRKSNLKTSLSNAESMHKTAASLNGIGSRGLSRLISATPKR